MSRRALLTRRSRLAVATRVTAVAVCLAAALGRPAAAGDGPREVVDATTSAVLAILGDKSLGSEEKRTKIEEVVYARVDFDTLSRLVLARNWNRLSDAQREEFTREFKRHLSLTYGRNVDNYRNERVNITGDRKETRGDWTVNTKIVRGGPDDILVNYRLRQKEGTWRIIDVIIEGVSLVSNFRSQFQEILSGGGPERLIDLLRQKNASGELLKS